MKQKHAPLHARAPTSLKALQNLEAFQTANAHIFPSVPSLRWFYRQHRAELLEAGAVVELAGRIQINARVFTAKALEIGARVARLRSEAVDNEVAQA